MRCIRPLTVEEHCLTEDGQAVAHLFGRLTQPSPQFLITQLIVERIISHQRWLIESGKVRYRGIPFACVMASRQTIWSL